MLRKHSRKLAWLVSAIITVIMFICIYFFLDFRYAVNDDAAILRAFMGFETEEICSFHPFIHNIFALPLAALGKAFPGVPWFTWLQLALLTVANIIISKSIIQSFQPEHFGIGVLLAIVFNAVISLPVCTKVTFTQTAGLLSAAAVLQILSSQPGKVGSGKLILQFIPALLCVVSAYGLRQITVIPTLAFCAIAFAYKCLCNGKLTDYKYMRPFIACMLIVAIVMGSLVLWRSWTLKNSGVESYMEWQETSTDLMDYHSFADLPRDVLQEVGWSPALTKLVSKSFFLDSSVNSDAMRRLLPYAVKAEVSGVNRIKNTLDAFAAKEQIYLLTQLFLLVMLILLLYTMIRIRENRCWNLAALGIFTLLTLVLILYLALQGRLPIRAVRMVMLPYAASLFGLYADSTRKSSLLRASVYVLTACALAFMFILIPTLTLNQEAAAEVGEPVQSLDEYALTEPDTLLVYDETLAIDSRLFPSVAEGIPRNVTFWGGWSMRSEGSIKQFDAYGIDLLDIDCSAFLDGRAMLVSGIIDPPPVDFMTWIEEKTGVTIDYEIYSEYDGLYIYTFYESDEPSWH